MSDNNELNEDQCNTIRSRFIKWDEAVTAQLAVCSSPNSSWGRLRPLMRLLEYSGHGVPWLVGLFVALIASHQIDWQQRLLNFCLALVLDIVFVSGIKGCVQRQRPKHNGTDQLVWSVDKFSFPSGHAARAALLTCYMSAHFEMGNSLLCLVVLWAAVLCVSRIMFGRHHVSDVLVGVIIGIIEYFALDLSNIWLSAETCMHVIQPIQEVLRL